MNFYGSLLALPRVVSRSSRVWIITSKSANTSPLLLPAPGSVAVLMGVCSAMPAPEKNGVLCEKFIVNDNDAGQKVHTKHLLIGVSCILISFTCFVQHNFC